MEIYKKIELGKKVIFRDRKIRDVYSLFNLLTHPDNELKWKNHIIDCQICKRFSKTHIIGDLTLEMSFIVKYVDKFHRNTVEAEQFILEWIEWYLYHNVRMNPKSGVTEEIDRYTNYKVYVLRHVALAHNLRTIKSNNHIAKTIKKFEKKTVLHNIKESHSMNCWNAGYNTIIQYMSIEMLNQISKDIIGSNKYIYYWYLDIWLKIKKNSHPILLWKSIKVENIRNVVIFAWNFFDFLDGITGDDYFLPSAEEIFGIKGDIFEFLEELLYRIEKSLYTQDEYLYALIYSHIYQLSMELSKFKDDKEKVINVYKELMKIKKLPLCCSEKLKGEICADVLQLEFNIFKYLNPDLIPMLIKQMNMIKFDNYVQKKIHRIKTLLFCFYIQVLINDEEEVNKYLGNMEFLAAQINPLAQGIIWNAIQILIDCSKYNDNPILLTPEIYNCDQNFEVDGKYLYYAL